MSPRRAPLRPFPLIMIIRRPHSNDAKFLSHNTIKFTYHFRALQYNHSFNVNSGHHLIQQIKSIKGQKKTDIIHIKTHPKYILGKKKKMEKKNTHPFEQH